MHWIAASHASIVRASVAAQGRSFNALGSGITDNIVARPVRVVRGATSSSLRRVVQDVSQLTSVSPVLQERIDEAAHWLLP